MGNPLAAVERIDRRLCARDLPFLEGKVFRDGFRSEERLASPRRQGQRFKAIPVRFADFDG